MGRTYGGRQSRVCIDARASRANMRVSLHIQHRRPNDRAYRAPNWNKHSLEQWAEVYIVVGGRECALMCALRAQTSAHNHMSSIGGQTDWPNGLKIGTHSHCDYAMKIGWSAIGSVHPCALCARKLAHTITCPVYAAKRHRTQHLHKHSLGR
jgi:hypothetical protein